MKAVSLAELATFINLSKRYLAKRAREECWAHKKNQKFGGLTKYFEFGDLPADIQSSLMSAHPYLFDKDVKNAFQKMEQVIEVGTNSSLELPTLKEIDHRQSISKSQERKLVLEFATVFAASLKQSKKQGWIQFCEKFNDGSLIVPHVKTVKKVGFSTLNRWQLNLQKSGDKALDDKRGVAKKGCSIIRKNKDFYDFCVGALYDFPHIKPPHLKKLMEANFGDYYKIPTINTIRLFLANWKAENQEAYLSISDPSAFKNKKMSAFGDKTQDATHINSLWEFDSTPTDVMLEDGRHSIIAVIDVFTRRVKIVLWKTSASMGVAHLIRNAILDWGIPDIARIDNGADYKSKHISGFWSSLDIDVDVTNPYSPWEKPFIERFFRTFSHGIVELLQGYIGHNVADREKINARLTFAERLLKRREKGKDNEAIDVALTSKKFEKIANQWLEYDYHHAEHGGIKTTPFKRFNEQKDHIRTVSDIRKLDILLAPVPGDGGIRKVTKEGIKVDGAYYIHGVLGGMMDDRVTCRWNPRDIGKILVFDTHNNQFICEAVNVDLADKGITYQHAVTAKKVQKAKLAKQREAMRAASKRFDMPNQAQKYLDYKEKQNGSLSSLPKASIEFENDVLKSLNEPEDDTPKYDTDKIAEFQKKLKEKQAREIEINPEPIFTSENHKAQYLYDLKAKNKIEPHQQAWLHKYRKNNREAAEFLENIFLKDSSNNKESK